MSGFGEFFYFVGIVDDTIFIGSLKIIVTSRVAMATACIRSSCRSPAILNNVSDMLSTTGSNRYS